MPIRVFHIVRDEDESGVSGTGLVAEACEFSDGTVIVRWRGDQPSTNIYNNFKQVENIHGHGGKTHLVLVYDETPPPEPEEEPESQKPTRKKRASKKTSSKD